ncbi:MAG: response regulator [Verrucomicrobia bacterium]|jgi:two-component system copper resistance phosphate regulon response regulator CusR|nr:response regulator [Verrucomicrobiota bacterium]
MRILIAEDESKVAQFLKKGFEEAGYAVDVAADGEEAIWLAENHPHDVWVLDIMMPGRDGVSVVRHLRRQNYTTPAILLSARTRIEDRIQGLDAGADDYLPKPFSLSELLARVRAVLRRQRPSMSNELVVADLRLDLVAHTAKRGAREITLTNREFALLERLMLASPKPVSKMAIVEHVWDQNFDSGTNVVQVYIKYLREKIDQAGETPLIHTVRGVGYALHSEAP